MQFDDGTQDLTNSQQLPTVQRWMQSVITHPAGVSSGIRSETSQKLISVSESDVESVIQPSETLTSLERLQIYGDAYFARLIGCLADEFPAVSFSVGEETFAGFVMGYLQSKPSTSYTLADLGSGFPDYLADSRPPKSGTDEGPNWTDFLIQLAKLERLYAEVFDGPGDERTASLTPEQLSDIDPNTWPECRLLCSESMRLVEFDFPVQNYAAAVRREETPKIPAAVATHLVLHRRDFVVRRRELTAPQWHLLRAIHEGQPIGLAIESVANTLSDDELVHFAGGLQHCFSEWTAAGMFRAITRD